MRRLKVKVGDCWYTVEVGVLEGASVQVLVDGEPVRVDLDDLRSKGKLSSEDAPQPAGAASTPSTQSRSPNLVRAPMPGVILSIDVRVGERVSAGSKVCVLEAMKMEQVLLAPEDGEVKVVHVQQGQSVTIGETIVELE
jgi:biotin carboxyl carrier protein